MPLTLPSFAKINWKLEILGRRADGYHEVRTVLQTISLADTLTFDETSEGVELICQNPEIPVDGTNLIERAATRFISETGLRRGVQITLEKRIPIAAGLGGGSSNAAVTLIALERLWKTGIDTKRLIGIAASLGADVPFFLEGGTALGIGRGDQIYELADVTSDCLLLINPGIAISAAEGYGRLPAELTLPYLKDKMPFSLEAGASGASAHQGVLGALRNDLEPGALAAYPELGEIRSRMSQAGAQQTLMSGSGSTFFALFESDATRDVAQQNLQDTGWWSAPVETVSRRRYRDALGLII